MPRKSDLSQPDQNDDPNNYSNVCHLSKEGESYLYTEDCPLDVLQPIFSEQYWLQKKAITGSASGRGTTLFIHYKRHDYILRAYLRGGIPGKILTNQFFFIGYEKTRAWQEFMLLIEMLDMDLPVPTPVAAHITRTGLIYRNHIIIKRIPRAKDLHEILCSRELAEEEWHKIGQTIQTFHEKQIYHHDLNIRNIMLDNKKQPWLIDFDKCAISSGESWKQQNINRLKRSLYKEKSKAQKNDKAFYWQEKDWQSLIDGYADRKSG